MVNDNAALALRTSPAVDSRMAVAPRNLQEVQAMAATVAKTGLYGVKSVEEAQVRMVTGMELGLSMMQSLRGVFVMSANGKMQPGLYADTMVGVCKSKAEICEHFTLLKSTAEVATYETKRRGDAAPTQMSFTIQEARQAGLAGKDVWKAYTAAMLRARASSALARAVYPDLLNGLYSFEELRDMGPSVVAGPAVEVIDSPPLEQQLQESIEQNEATDQVFTRLMCALLDARSMAALDEAMAMVATSKDALNKEQLTKLRQAAKESRKTLEGLQPDAAAQ